MIEFVTGLIQPKRDIQFSRTLKLISYLDKHFVSMKLWPDWIVFKESLKQQARSSQHLERTRISAEKRLWQEFLAANFCQDDTPKIQNLLDFIVAIEEQELPLYVLRLHVGNLIYHGKTEEEATETYRTFLRESQENAVYGDYILTPSFAVVPASETLLF